MYFRVFGRLAFPDLRAFSALQQGQQEALRLMFLRRSCRSVVMFRDVKGPSGLHRAPISGSIVYQSFPSPDSSVRPCLLMGPG